VDVGKGVSVGEFVLSSPSMVMKVTNLSFHVPISFELLEELRPSLLIVHSLSPFPTLLSLSALDWPFLHSLRNFSRSSGGRKVEELLSFFSVIGSSSTFIVHLRK
jgi:hypothetical protein